MSNTTILITRVYNVWRLHNKNRLGFLLACSHLTNLLCRFREQHSIVGYDAHGITPESGKTYKREKRKCKPLVIHCQHTSLYMTPLVTVEVMHRGVMHSEVC